LGFWEYRFARSWDWTWAGCNGSLRSKRYVRLSFYKKITLLVDDFETGQGLSREGTKTTYSGKGLSRFGKVPDSAGEKAVDEVAGNS